MKKLLPLSCLFILFIFSGYSQVVDITGKGIKGIENSNLQILDLDFIERVEVGAFYKGGKTTPDIDAVLFQTTNGGPSSNFNDDIITKLRPNKSAIETIGYFSESFESVDDSGINVSVKPFNYVHSFYSYIYRNDITSESKSYFDLTPTFYYHNGASDPYTYEVKIEKANISRQVKIKIPVSELDAGSRMVVIKIKAGPVTFETEEYTWNFGNSFFIGEYLLKNIPGKVDKVTVSIHSPNNTNGEENGDSFFVSGIIVDVEKVGCTLTQGYWKTHSECKKNGNGPKRDATWDYVGDGDSPETTTLFFKSEKTYCEIYDTQPNNKNGKYYILAHQYIATELNLYNNSDPTDIAEAFKEATNFLEKYTPEDVRNDKNLQNKAVKLGGILDDYNNGELGRGHCDDNDVNDDENGGKNDNDNRVERIIIKEPLHAKKIKVFPNPVVNKGQIAFKAVQSGTTSVELFNTNGQKVAELYNANSKKGSDLLIEFSTSHLKKGLYFAIIKNGNDVFRHTIAVSD